MKISVVTPVLNEIRFIKGWLSNVRKFADEIIVIDTGSSDGTWEHLTMQRDIFLYRWQLSTKPYEWAEHEIRNRLIEFCSGDYIVPLDADELVDNTFINSLNYLDSHLIHKYLKLDFWGDYKTLRKRNILPFVEIKDGKLRYFRNWRGQYPHYQPRAFKRDEIIRYTETGNHCCIQYKNFGRWSYRLPLTKTHEIPVYHYHYLTRKPYNGRDGETNFKTIEYLFKHPSEVNLYNLTRSS